MKELEKILEEICSKITESMGKKREGLLEAVNIIRKHMNDGWISVEQKPNKDYIAVLAVDKHDYYFVAVYDKEHGYRTNDVGADVDNIVSYCLFNPYRPERSEK